MLRRNAIFLLAPLALNVLPAQAADILIVGTGQTYTTISQAITAAASGDTIKVNNGTYNETLNLTGSKDLVIRATNDFGATITVPDTHSGVIYSGTQTAASYLIGFIIQGAGSGTSSTGVVINSTASPNIVFNIFETTGGPAISISGGNAVIEDNDIVSSACSSTSTGAIQLSGDSSASVFNNLITTSGCNGIYDSTNSSAAPFIGNNTIVGTPTGIVMTAAPNATHRYLNNLLSGNTIGVAFDGPADSGTAIYNSWNNNLVFGGTPYATGFTSQTGNNHNISVDPQFTTPGTNYTLKSTSPAIDAGSNTGLPTIVTSTIDLAAHGRIDSGTGVCPAVIDIGAYEFQTTTNCNSSGNFSGSGAMPMLTVLALAGAGFVRRRKKA